MIIVIEGIPGSGKTSLQKHLSKELGLFSIPEVLIKKQTKNIPNARMQQQKWFWENDMRKIELALKKKKAVLDRNYVSTLGYNWSIPDNEPLYKKLLNLYIKNINKIKKPDCYIYLDVPVKLSLKRKNRLNSKTDEWTDKKFLINYKKFYNFFFSSLEKEIQIIRVDASLPMKDIIIYTIKRLKQL